jgi:hypothetical protein
MKRLFVLLLPFVFLQLPAQRYANEFLYIGVDAAALAQGGSVAAGVSGANAVYWNPAGLTGFEGRSVALMHAAYFHNQAQLDYLAYGKQIDNNSSAGVALLRFGVDNIMNTTKLIDENGDVDYNRITYFSAADYAFLFSYARKNIYKNWHAGISIKIIYRHIGDFAQGFGFGFDAGVQYNTEKWLFGFVLRDATTTNTFWSFNRQRLDEIRDAIPGYNQTEPQKHELSLPKFQTGIARRFTIKKDYTLAAELDFSGYFYQRRALINSGYFSLEPSLGLQAGYRNKVFFRTGINNIYQTEIFGEKVWKFNPSAGIGIKFKHLDLDYAFTGFAESGLHAHVFSLVLDLKIFKKQE